MLVSARSYVSLDSDIGRRVAELLGKDPKFDELPNIKEITAADFWHHVSIWGMPRGGRAYQSPEGW